MEGKHKLSLFYSSKLTQTLRLNFNRLDVELTSEEANGLLALVYVYLTFNLRNSAKSYFLWYPEEAVTHGDLDIELLINCGVDVCEEIRDLLDKDYCPYNSRKYIIDTHITDIYTKQDLIRFIWPYETNSSLPGSYAARSRLEYDTVAAIIGKHHYVHIISSPNKKHWVVINSATSSYLNGIKLGCKLFDVKESDYVYLIPNKDKIK